MNAPDYALPPSAETLYTDHHGWLKAWLHRRLGNGADAADLAQDTFVRLLGKSLFPRFGNHAEARAYLRTVGSALCVDLWRRREVEQAWLDTLAARPEVQAPSAEEQAMVLQALCEVDAMLRSLPAKAARAFVLATLCGMTHQEVAREIGVSSRMVGHYITLAMLHCMQLEARHVASAAPEAR